MSKQHPLEWHNAPNSRHHWLVRGGLAVGMVYQVNPTAFTVYQEYPRNLGQIQTRESVTQVPTLDEAKGLLMTLVGSQT